MKAFEIYCPAGWTHIDLSDDLSRQSRFVTESLIPAGGRDRRGPVVRLAAARLETSLKELAGGGAWSVMMPVTGPTALAMRPTIAFSPLALPAQTQPMDALVALASSDSTAEVIDIDPLVALRTTSEEDITKSFVSGAIEFEAALPPSLEATTFSDAADGQQRAIARRVRYVLGDATDNDKWTDAFFSLTHLDDPEQRDVADSAVAAFDALIKTFRWLS